jgi:hypothetical protein
MAPALFDIVNHCAGGSPRVVTSMRPPEAGRYPSAPPPASVTLLVCKPVYGIMYASTRIRNGNHFHFMLRDAAPA